MKILNAFKSLVSDSHAALVLLFKDNQAQYEVFLKDIKQNNITELQALSQKLSGGEKKALFAKAYNNYGHFLSHINSKKMLELLLTMGLDIHKNCANSKKHSSNNMPQKAPALFYALALPLPTGNLLKAKEWSDIHEEHIKRFDRVRWLIECGANLKAKDNKEKSFLKLLLAEYNDYAKTLYTTKEYATQDLNGFLSVLSLMKKNNYNFSEVDSVTKEYVALECMAYNIQNPYVQLAPVLDFMLNEVKNINYPKAPPKALLDKNQYVPNTFFTYALSVSLPTPYVDILLDKYQSNEAQLQNFSEQLKNADRVDPMILQKLNLLIERHALMKQVEVLAPENAPKKKKFKM